MAQKFWYIIQDLCEFFQILESGDFFFSFLKKNDILKTKSKQVKKIWYVFFDRYFHKENYGEDLRHYRQIFE